MTKFLEIAASPVSLDAKLKALAISLDKTLPDLYNKVVIVEKQQGPKGDKGDQGDKGSKGDQGDTGLPGANGLDGRDGADGKDGKDGKDGVSVVDVYISADNSLVCVLSDGREVDAGPLGLEGNKNGDISVYAHRGIDLSSLPLATDFPKPVEVIVKQDNEWVRATWSQFASWLGAVGVINKILTENGDFLVAEDGSYLIEE